MHINIHAFYSIYVLCTAFVYELFFSFASSVYKNTLYELPLSVSARILPSCPPPDQEFDSLAYELAGWVTLYTSVKDLKWES